MLKKALYLCGTRIVWWIESSEVQHLIEIFGNSVKIFDQFNASLLDKSIHFFLCFNLPNPKLLNGSVQTHFYVTEKNAVLTWDCMNQIWWMI